MNTAKQTINVLGVTLALIISTSLVLIFVVKPVGLSLYPDTMQDSAGFHIGHLYFSCSGILALFVSYAGLRLFMMHSRRSASAESSEKQTGTQITLIVLCGIGIRLMLAYFTMGNWDIPSYRIVADIMSRDGNIYAETVRYNYSPLWSFVLHALSNTAGALPRLPFHFVVKSFICLVDLMTLFILLAFARKEKLSLVKCALFFYLNPISFLISGFHGQFDNFALAPVLAGAYIYLHSAGSKRVKCLALWALAALGMLIKHLVFFHLLISVNFAFKRNLAKAGAIAVVGLVFLATFIPYWEEGRANIVQNVFLYSSITNIYGISSLIDWPPLKYLFLLGLIYYIFTIRDADLIRQCLGGTLFFLTFTTGIAVQYFVLPLVFGALRPSRGFIVYTICGTLFLLGSEYNLYLPLLRSLDINIVWIGAVYWFVTEELSRNNRLKDFLASLTGNTIHNH